MKTISFVHLLPFLQNAILLREDASFEPEFVDVEISSVRQHDDEGNFLREVSQLNVFYGKAEHRGSIAPLDVTPELQAWFESL